MKKYKKPETIDECWDLCLKMWRWIDKERKKYKLAYVTDLKNKWLNAHYDGPDLMCGCFFCQWAVDHGQQCCNGFRNTCPQCPGAAIDPDFGCQDGDEHWSANPHKFYLKIRRLNEERKNALGA